MDKMDKGSSSIYRLEAHLCFKIKYCHKVFDIAEFKQRCDEIFLEVAAKYHFLLNHRGFDRDHVHLAVRYKHPKA
jgi:REP element-mobilizing transposase RayT